MPTETTVTVWKCQWCQQIFSTPEIATDHELSHVMRVEVYFTDPNGDRRCVADLASPDSGFPGLLVEMVQDRRTGLDSVKFTGHLNLPGDLAPEL